MKVLDVKQGSEEWLRARAGIPTASEFDALVTPKWKVRTGQGVETYLHKKLAEAWLGGPLPTFGGAGAFVTEQGIILESEALPWFELEHGAVITKAGFITTDDGRVGCSPDGLLGDDGGVEVKCPEAHTHAGYILAGTLPEDYQAQVHGSMFVTGRPSWTFVSYRRHFPPLVLQVERDDEIQKVLSEALDGFLARFDEAWKRMVDLNGGPPLRRRGNVDPLWMREPA